jgi:hypothetical protein
MRARATVMWGVLTVMGLLITGHRVGAMTPATPWDAVRHLLVFHQGRPCSFERFARERVHRLGGSALVKAGDPIGTILAIMARPDEWRRRPIIQTPSQALRARLGLLKEGSDPSGVRPHVSVERLAVSPLGRLVRMMLSERLAPGRPLTALERDTLQLAARVAAFEQLCEQELWLVPPPAGQRGDWLPVLQPDGYRTEQQIGLKRTWSLFLAAVREGQPERIEGAARQMSRVLHHLAPQEAPRFSFFGGAGWSAIVGLVASLLPIAFLMRGRRMGGAVHQPRHWAPIASLCEAKHGGPLACASARGWPQPFRFRHSARRGSPSLRAGCRPTRGVVTGAIPTTPRSERGWGGAPPA